MPSQIGARLRRLRGRLSQSEFADSLGVHPNTLGNYERDQRSPTTEFLEQLVKAGYNANWLISGDGPERLEDLGGNQFGGLEEQVSGEFAVIPLYDVEASAGDGHLVPNEEVVDLLAFKREWIHQELHAQPSDLYLLFVSGDSMEPTLRPGDLILVDKRGSPIRADGIYVLVIEGALLVKRLQTLLDGKVRIVSDNSVYPAMEAHRDQMNWGVQDGGGVDVIGRVVWAGRRF